MILFDTCVLYWLASNRAKLSRPADEAIRIHHASLHASAISSFEVSLSYRKKGMDRHSAPSLLRKSDGIGCPMFGGLASAVT